MHTIQKPHTLTVKGSADGEQLVLRLAASNPKLIEIDFGDDGSAEHAVKRKDVERIRA